MGSGISVVVNTLNEERNLPFCLGSVQAWADEIIVVDMHSDDRTVEIAEGFGARVFPYERLGYSEPAREFAIAQATKDWVLILDADEMIPAPLSLALQAIVREAQSDVVTVHRLNYFFGAPMIHTGFGAAQERHMRFFRRGMLYASAEIHRFMHPVAGARIIDLPYSAGHAIVHFAYVDFAQYIDKLNRYTSIEAEEALVSGLRVSPLRAVAHAALTFTGRYIYPKGYRDGWRGFYVSLALAFYRIAIYAKVTERKHTGGRDAVQEHYQQEAARLLEAYRPPVG